MPNDDTKALKASVQYLKRRILDLELELLSRNHLCSKCSSVVKKNERVTEDRIYDVLVNSGIGACSRNKRCSRYRPDIVIDGGTHFVIVEVDEHQHKTYTENKEERMLSVKQALLLPTTFVRFNPDEYKPGDDSREANDDEREIVLVSWVDKLLKNEVPRVSDAQVIYLFFDGFVNGKETVCEISTEHDFSLATDEDEPDIVIEKLVAGAQDTALPDEQWARLARCYMDGWGLDRLDETFVRDHGASSTCPKVAELIRVLYPPLCAEAILNTSVSGRVTAAACKRTLRSPIIIEVIAALGLASPFDTARRIPDLMAVWEERLKHTQFFADYQQSSKLLGITGKTTEWNLLTVSKALGALFKSIGLHLNSTRTQSRIAGKKVNYFSYLLDAVKCSEMLELVRLKARNSQFRSATPNKHARDLILLDDYPKYGHLLDLTAAQ